MVILISTEEIGASEIRKHFSLLARLESAYSLIERGAEDLGKRSGCFMIIRWPISCHHFNLSFHPG